MYGISSARRVSTTTSEPQPGALAPVRFTGRSSSRREGWAPVVGAAAAAFELAVVTGTILWFGGVHPDRTGSARLAQPRRQPHAGVAIGGLHLDLALEIDDGADGVVAHPPVGAAGVEAECREPALDLLELGKPGSALPAREFRRHLGRAQDAVAEVHERKRVIH